MHIVLIAAAVIAAPVVVFVAALMVLVGTGHRSDWYNDY